MAGSSWCGESTHALERGNQIGRNVRTHLSQTCDEFVHNETREHDRTTTFRRLRWSYHGSAADVRCSPPDVDLTSQRIEVVDDQTRRFTDP